MGYVTVAGANRSSTTKRDRRKLARLYEKDETGWLEATVRLIEERRYDELDYKNLIDFLQSMARRDRREMFSRLVTLLTHLLKWEHQPSRRSRSWATTIRLQQEELREELSSGALRNHADEALSKAYTRAVLKAVSQTGLSEEAFSAECPYTLDEALNVDVNKDTEGNKG